MYLETFVKYTYWTGMYKKINVREDGYDIITSYKLRWWHPFNWILTLVAILAGTFHLAIEIIKENNDEFQIREDKKMDS